MPTYRSSVGDQLERADRQARQTFERIVKARGRRFRARMNRERLSGPPGVHRVTGRLKRSLRYKVLWVGWVIVIRAAIGGGPAPHGGDLEDGGLLEFKRVFTEEMNAMMEEARIAAKFIGRDLGGGAGDGGGDE